MRDLGTYIFGETAHDFVFHDRGTIGILEAKSNAAKKWLQSNVDNAFCVDGTIAIERRYAGGVLAGAQLAGLVIADGYGCVMDVPF